MRAFGASDASLAQAKDYAFWMFVAALANLPAQSMNCAARAKSSVKITSIAVVTGAALNVILDPIFMFDWGLGMAVEGASLATSVSQFVTFFIMAGFYISGRSVIKLLISQAALFPAFGLRYMMTITFQTIGDAKYGLFLSLIRQGLFYVPFILLLPRFFGVVGIYLSQPAADVLTILVCVCSIRKMKTQASLKMNATQTAGASE